MQDINPYAPPSAVVLENAERLNFKEYSTSELKTFCNAWRRIFGVCLVIATIWLLFAFTLMNVSGLTSLTYQDLFYLAMTLYVMATVFCVFIQVRWGFILLFLLCLCAVPLFPIGTYLGISGLFGLVKGYKYFGSEQLRFKDLYDEYLYRRKHKVT